MMKLCVPACRPIALALAAMFSATSSAGQGLDDPPSLVSYFDNYGDSSIADIRLRGSVRGIDYSIAAARTDTNIILDISLKGRSAQLRLLREDFPEIDLGTIREGVSDDVEPPTLRLRVEYGQLGGCFDNREAPRRLTISFNAEGRISASRLIAEGCQLVWRRLNLVETGPSIYTATIES